MNVHQRIFWQYFHLTIWSPKAKVDQSSINEKKYNCVGRGKISWSLLEAAQSILEVLSRQIR